MVPHPAFKLAGIILVALGLMQLIPLAVGLLFDEPQWSGFAISAACAASAGALLILATRQCPVFTERDGFAGATFAMLAAVCAGALPYLLSGSVAGFTDAVFESMSGFTTTGASIITDYDGMSKSLMLWRSMTQWLGGLGFALIMEGRDNVGPVPVPL